MSLIAKMFGGGKGGKGASTQEAIKKLRETEDMLSKKQEFLEKEVHQELELAKRHGTRNKRAAVQALRRKRRFQKQLEQIDGTLSTIEFQRESLENANTSSEVLRTMNYAAQAMKAASTMDLDNVEDLMADISEQRDLASEISEAISKPASYREDLDEEELLSELEQLQQEELEENLVETSLPNVPSTSLPNRPVKKDDDDDDMEGLQQWALEAM